MQTLENRELEKDPTLVNYYTNYIIRVVPQA